MTAVTTTPSNAELKDATSVITLPTWTDAPSVASFLTSAFGIVLTVVGVADPTIIPALSADGQLVIPTIGAVIAGVAQLVNVVMHRKALISAQNNIATIAAARIARTA